MTSNSNRIRKETSIQHGDNGGLTRPIPRDGSVDQHRRVLIIGQPPVSRPEVQNREEWPKMARGVESSAG